MKYGGFVTIEIKDLKHNYKQDYKDFLKHFLEEESKKYGLGSVHIEEKEYSDYDPVFVIDVAPNMSFDEMDKVWDNIIENTDEYISSSENKELINFYQKTFISLRI